MDLKKKECRGIVVVRLEPDAPRLVTARADLLPLQDNNKTMRSRISVTEAVKVIVAVTSV